MAEERLNLEPQEEERESRPARPARKKKKKGCGCFLLSLLAYYAEGEDLIRIGAYRKGSDPRIDWALAHLDRVRAFLVQSVDESFSFEDTVQRLVSLVPEPEGLGV